MNKKILALLGATTIIGLIGYFIIPPLFHLTSDEYGFIYGLVLMMSVAATAAIWFLLTTLKAFKASTRHAYYVIAASIFLFALTQIEQIVVLTLITLFPDFDPGYAILSLLFLAIYIATSITLFVGIRKLGHVLGVHSKWASLIVVPILAVLAGVAGAVLLRTSSPDPEAQSSAAIIFGTASFASIFAAAGSIIAYKIKHAISPNYQNSMNWLCLAAAAMAFSVIHEIIVKGTALSESWYAANGLSGWPLVAAGLLFMKAGQVLKSATFKTLPLNATYLDSVVFTAQMVSDPHAVNPSLDKLRQVTAHIHPGDPLSPKDKQILINIYFDLEEYLVTKEPLRKIAKPDLRARLTPQFQSELQQYEGQRLQSTPAAS